jgi:hypothetical protein
MKSLDVSDDAAVELTVAVGIVGAVIAVVALTLMAMLQPLPGANTPWNCRGRFWVTLISALY